MRPDWLLLARPLIRANVALPLMLGQLMAFAITHQFSWALMSWSLTLLLPLQLAWTLAESAGESGRPHPDETSPAHLVEVLFVRLFGPGGLRTALALVVGLGLLAATILAWRTGRWLVPPGVALVGLGAWVYGYPPVSLARRGQSELVVGAMVGVVLPLMGFVVQTGTIDGFGWAACFPAFLLGFAADVSAQLPAAAADRIEGRRSYPVRKGEYEARRHTLELLVVAATMTPLVLPGLPIPALIPIVAIPLGMVYANMGLLRRADAEHRDQCLAFVLVNGATIQGLLAAWTIALLIRGLMPAPELMSWWS